MSVHSNKRREEAAVWLTVLQVSDSLVLGVRTRIQLDIVPEQADTVRLDIVPEQADNSGS